MIERRRDLGTVLAVWQILMERSRQRQTELRCEYSSSRGKAKVVFLYFFWYTAAAQTRWASGEGVWGRGGISGDG
jgi:hypothetical protein